MQRPGPPLPTLEPGKWTFHCECAFDALISIDFIIGNPQKPSKKYALLVIQLAIQTRDCRRTNGHAHSARLGPTSLSNNNRITILSVLLPASSGSSNVAPRPQLRAWPGCAWRPSDRTSHGVCARRRREIFGAPDLPGSISF